MRCKEDYNVIRDKLIKEWYQMSYLGSQLFQLSSSTSIDIVFLPFPVFNKNDRIEILDWVLVAI